MSDVNPAERIFLFFAYIGRALLRLLAAVGRVGIFAATTIGRGFQPPYYPGRFLQQVAQIGWFSLPVVGMTAVFTGAAMAQQTFTGLRFNAEVTVPAIVVFAIIRELGPVLVGLMVAGRVASAMAAELGTMRVTEQLDAMATLRTDPYRYLIAPRVFAAVMSLPLLVLIANAIAIFGGYLLAIDKLGLNPARYLEVTRDYFHWHDVVISEVKAGVFGFWIGLMGCYNGFRTEGGAAGVGEATTNAVVSAFILILLSNFLLTVAAFG